MPALNDPPAHPINAIAIIDRSGGHVGGQWLPGLDPRELALFVEAYRGELDGICAAWNLPVPGLAVYTPHHQQAMPDEAALLLVDSDRNPNAYGAHTALGLSVWGYVDIGQVRRDGHPWQLIGGHELYEMILNPYLVRYSGPYADGTHVPVEACDPVQANYWTKHVKYDLLGEGGDVAIAEWVYPSWFEAGSAGPWSSQGSAPGPLLDAPGGYHQRVRDGKIIGGALVRVHGRSWRIAMGSTMAVP